MTLPTVTIKMTGYARKKRNNDVWASKPFYTSNKEFKIELITVTPADDSSYDNHGSYMSVQLNFTHEGTQGKSTFAYYEDECNDDCNEYF